MNSARIFRTLWFAALAITVTACSSSGTINVRQAVSQPIPPGSTVALSVKSLTVESQDQSATEDTAETMKRLRAELFGRLVAEGIFKQVLHEGELADYVLTVTLTHAREVSTGARIFFGVFAGANALSANVQLSEVQGETIVADFTVRGESASHPLSSEAGLDDAIREAVDKIIVGLQ